MTGLICFIRMSLPWQFQILLQRPAIVFNCYPDQQQVRTGKCLLLLNVWYVYRVIHVGWSKPSAKLLHFTLPDVPTAPSKVLENISIYMWWYIMCSLIQVELLKVNKNGLVVSWYPPYQNNGCKVTVYQLEMTDWYAACSNILSHTFTWLTLPFH